MMQQDHERILTAQDIAENRMTENFIIVIKGDLIVLGLTTFLNSETEDKL